MTRLSHSVVSLFSTPVSELKVARKPLTVSELILEVKARLESAYRDIAVIGEVSSFKAWRSGHWYFDLKDEQSLIPAVMFKNLCGRVKFEVQDGMQVLVTGRMSVYAPQSRMQIIIDNIEPVGIGALALAFEQLKKRLECEGLFAPAAKKSLPKFPLTVGLVTSPQGAALRDMLRIFSQRMPGINIVIASVRVQGEGAASEIANAIERLDQIAACDVMIVGRGGGSLEDLWAFNEERVARAIFACRTPIVSAVGHETDFSIADFVADLRCATPTHAAQTAVPDKQELKRSLNQNGHRLVKQIKMLMGRQRLALERFHRRLKEPRTQLREKRKRVDELLVRLEKRQQVMMVKARQRLQVLAARLQGISPLAVLSRGYAAVYRGDTVLMNALDVRIDDELNVRMRDGIINVLVRSVENV